MSVRVPEDTHRTIIIGRTGEGKTVRMLDILVRQNFDEIPWVLIDYKGDPTLIEMVAKSKGKIKTIKVTDKPPTKPGLYYMHPMPIIDDDHMERFLWAVHKQGDFGIVCDEGYALPKYGETKAFSVILTQGRALHIPVICLYQRPTWMNRFAPAMSDFRCLMKMDDKRDEDTARQYVRPAKTPNGLIGPKEMEQLPKYYSLWHDVGQGEAYILLPAPPPNVTIDRIIARLSPQRSHVISDNSGKQRIGMLV